MSRLSRNCIAVVFTAQSLCATAQELADPTRPPDFSSTTGTGIAAMVNGNSPRSLNMLLIGQSRRIGIIDAQVVAPGDTVAGFKVIELGKDSAVLGSGTANRQLSIYPDLTRQVQTKTQPRSSTAKSGRSAGMAQQRGNGDKDAQVNP